MADPAPPTVDEIKTVVTPPSVTTTVSQDPLPEPSFFWRRWIAIFLLASFWWMLWHALFLVPAVDLLSFSQGVMLLTALVLLLYFGGASATDLTGLVQAAKIRIGRFSERSSDGSAPGTSRQSEPSEGG